MNFGNPPTDRTRNLDGGLVRLEFDNRLVRLDDVAFFNQQRDDIARLDILAQVGQFELRGHGN